MADYILDKVIHYGAFKENLDKVVDVMRSEYAGSLIIRGNPGAGKRTLIEEASKISKVRCVYVSSHFYSEDYMAMKAIASELGFKTRAAHISDLMNEIKDSARDKEKLVIILLDFEEFCRKRQSLLYNLMNLIHTNPNEADEGINLTLVGLTVNVDWFENIEKRVRSRLNAKCIDLTFPYRNSEELIEFTSELLDGYKINVEFREHLTYIYNILPNPSTRTIKKYLSNMCDLNDKGKVVVNFDPSGWHHDHQINTNVFLRERLRFLTRSQLDLLKLAVSYCYTMDERGFSIMQLAAYLINRNYKAFMPHSQMTLWDLSLLLRLRLIKPAKYDQPLTQEATFYPAVTGRQFKAVIEGDQELWSTQTDRFWRNLK